MSKYKVRFYVDTTTADRHSIVVEAPSREAARRRVEAGFTGILDFTDEEVLSETLEKEGDVLASEFARLSDDEPIEVLS